MIKQKIISLIKKYGEKRSSLIPILQHVQQEFSYIPIKFIKEIALLLKTPTTEIYSIISFYDNLTINPTGKIRIKLCSSITCSMQKNQIIADYLEKKLKIKFGETTRDKKFSLEKTSCLGYCDQGPALLVNNVLHKKVTIEKIDEIIEKSKNA